MRALGDARQCLVPVARDTSGLPIDAEALPCAWHHQSDEGLLTIYPPEFRAWAANAATSVGRAPRREGAVPHHVPLSGVRRQLRPLRSPTHRPARSTASIRRSAPTFRRCRSGRPPRREPPSHRDRGGHPIGTTSSEEPMAWPAAGGHAPDRSPRHGRPPRRGGRHRRVQWVRPHILTCSGGPRLGPRRRRGWPGSG